MYEDDFNVVYYVPCEMLIKIFKLLSLKTMTSCRAVCWRWQQVVDLISTEKKLWRDYCETEYKDIWYSAHVKSTRDLSWYNLYKSLTLWARLAHSHETTYEIDISSNHEESCINFQVLRDGVIGILTERSLVYYRLDTLQQIPELTIIDKNENIMYKENENSIILLNITEKLVVRRKENRNKILTVFKDVLYFTIIENIIHYVTNSNTIYKCTFVGGTYYSTSVVRIPDDVLWLGHENGILYIMTYDFKIYSYVNDTLRIVFTNGTVKEKLEALKRYNFVNHTDWETMFDFYQAFLDNVSDDFPEKKNIQIIRIHGPVMLVGYKNCILRIFYSLYTNSVIDLFQSEPLKVCHLLNQNEEKSMSTILNIDVVEGKRSHTVLVTLPLKIVAIKFSHLLSGKESSPCYEETLTSSNESLIGNKEPRTSCEIQDTSHEEPTTSHDESAIFHEEPVTSHGAQASSNVVPTTSREKSAISHEELSASCEALSTSCKEKPSSHQESQSTFEEPLVSPKDPSTKDEKHSISSEELSTSSKEAIIGTKEISTSSGEGVSSTEEPVAKMPKMSDLFTF